MEQPQAVRPVQLDELKGGAEGPRAALDGSLELVQDVKVRLAVSVGATSLTVGELFGLKEGATLKLDKTTSDPIDLYLDARLVARGELMASGDHFAVRITEIGGEILIPFKPADDVLAALVPAALLLIVLLVAAAALLWWTRRGGGAGAAQGARRRLRVVERLALSRGAALILVEYEGRALLIGQSAERISLIERGAARAPEPD